MHGHLILLILTGVAAATRRRSAQNISRYERSIRAFETADRTHPPPLHGTVFVGSSTFTRWRSLEATFADIQAINRGFGGSTIPEITYYLDRIVVPHQPDRVVFYAGTNDIALGHSGYLVAQNFAAFVRRLHDSLPGTPVSFVSLNPGPRRRRLAKVFDEANALVLQSMRDDDTVRFIDIRPVMKNSFGRLDGTLFGWDRLHMNERGHLRWVPELRKALT